MKVQRARTHGRLGAFTVATASDTTGVAAVSDAADGSTGPVCRNSQHGPSWESRAWSLTPQDATLPCF